MEYPTQYNKDVVSLAAKVKCDAKWVWVVHTLQEQWADAWF